MRQWKMGPSSLSSSSSLSLARISGWEYGAVKLRGRRECVCEREREREKGGEEEEREALAANNLQNQLPAL